jgi:hypothetical protein
MSCIVTSRSNPWNHLNQGGTHDAWHQTTRARRPTVSGLFWYARSVAHVGERHRRAMVAGSGHWGTAALLVQASTNARPRAVIVTTETDVLPPHPPPGSKQPSRARFQNANCTSREGNMSSHSGLNTHSGVVGYRLLVPRYIRSSNKGPQAARCPARSKRRRAAL